MLPGFSTEFPPPPRQLSHSPSTLPAPPAPPHPLRRALFPPQAVRQKGKKRPSEFRDEMFPNLTKKNHQKKKRTRRRFFPVGLFRNGLHFTFPFDLVFSSALAKKKRRKETRPIFTPHPWQNRPNRWWF